MTTWIAIILSTISLLISIIGQRKNLIEALKDYQRWQKERSERKSAIKAIEGFMAVDNIEKKEKGISTFFLLLPFFLLSVVSSGVLSLYVFQTPKDLILSGLTIYFFSSLLVSVVFLVIYKELNWGTFILLFSFAATFGMVWSFLTVIASYFFQLAWAGTISGAILTTAIWSSQLNKYKKKNKRSRL
ncbi:MAG: hypothetical protein IH589_20825 [Anaerolineales bacterium]|nr:hypothetical protein [Anaerolineales bacterium]